MTIIEQEIVEHLRKLDTTQQEQVLAFIQSLEALPTPNPEETWTDEEIAELMEERRKAKPKTGAEIVAMIQEWDPSPWAHIQDGREWVEEQRRQHKR